MSISEFIRKAKAEHSHKIANRELVKQQHLKEDYQNTRREYIVKKRNAEIERSTDKMREDPYMQTSGQRAVTKVKERIKAMRTAHYKNTHHYKAPKVGKGGKSERTSVSSAFGNQGRGLDLGGSSKGFPFGGGRGLDFTRGGTETPKPQNEGVRITIRTGGSTPRKEKKSGLDFGVRKVF